ncbi:MAG: GAF domain-containing protein [Cytophagia bacterium]|nr:GAF domain-containing protein [Cytophagia bacterium]
MMKAIDPHRISLILAVLFVLGLGATAYSVYSLEADNTTQVWIFMTLSTLLGGASLILALRNKKEILVFKEKSSSDNNNDASYTANAADGNIDLTEIKEIARKGGKDATLNALKTICRQLEAGQGALYAFKQEDDRRWIELAGGYALTIGENATIKFDLGEGLVGQSAVVGKTLYIDEVPEGYMKIASGLGMASPRYLLITPLKKEEQVIGIWELSTFKALTANQRKFVEDAANLLSANV